MLLKFLRSIRRKIRRKKVVCDGSFVEEAVSSDAEFEDFLQHERRKPDLKDFTLSEYTEKGMSVINLYSYFEDLVFCFSTLNIADVLC